MPEVSMAWRTRLARIALERWNQERPERAVAWEWIEEMLCAWRRYQDERPYNPAAAGFARRDFQEFARKLPSALVEAIMGPHARPEEEHGV